MVIFRGTEIDGSGVDAGIDEECNGVELEENCIVGRRGIVRKADPFVRRFAARGHSCFIWYLDHGPQIGSVYAATGKREEDECGWERRVAGQESGGEWGNGPKREIGRTKPRSTSLGSGQ